MADIKFDIQVVGADKLKRAADDFDRLGTISTKLSAQYKPLAAQTTRLVSEQNRLAGVKKKLAKAVKDEIITSNAATRALNEEIRKSQARIQKDNVLIAQARKKAKAEREAAKETERLTRLYAPARKAQEQYARSFDEINQAVKRNVISSREAELAIRNLDTEFRQFEKGLATGGNQFAKFNVETYKAIQARKRFASVGAQQAGYQIGDFFVQLQSGTNIAVAFGQQMSQLLGIFGAFGALAGAGVAIATSFIAPMIEMRKKTNEVQEALGSLFGALEENATTMEELLDTKLTGSLETARQKAIETRKTLEAVFLADIRTSASQKLLPDLEALTDFAEDLRQKKGVFGGFFNGAIDIEGIDDEKLALDLDRVTLQISNALVGPIEDMPEKLIEALKILEDSPLNVKGSAVNNVFKSLARTINSSGIAKIAEKDVTEAIEKTNEAREKTSENLEEANRSLETALKLEQEREAQQKKILQNYYEMRVQRDAVLGRVPFFINNERQNEAVKILRERLRTEKKIKEFVEDQSISVSNQVELLRAKLKFGVDSAEVTEVEKDQTLDAYKIELKKQGVVGEQYTELLRIKEAQIDLTDELEKQLELQKEQNKQQAIYFNGVPLDAQRRLKRFSRGAKPIDRSPFFANEDGEVSLEDMQKEYAKIQEAIEKYTDSLVQQVEKESQIITLFGEQRELQEALIVARQKYGDTASEAQMKVINLQIEQIHQLQKTRARLEDTRKEQEQLANFVGNAMGNALMSIVDGTADVKDAFKIMAAEIIKELYRVLVVQRLVKMATSFFGFQDGGVFSGGNVVPFAKGGVVGGPMTFPMSNGRTGLMGEAGPEAIMPLKRGKDGKLGVSADGSSAGNVNIVQNFNYSANGDESVQRIIAKSIPEITEAAKAGVLDARKRGGQFRRVFS